MNNFRIKLECANFLSFEIEIKFVHLQKINIFDYEQKTHYKFIHLILQFTSVIHKNKK
jgi:hypothetical protein